MRRADIATATAAGLALALAAQPERPAMRYSISLPRLEQRVAPAPIIVPPPRLVYRPASAGALIDALTVPKALILPAAGRYWLPVQARVAAGVTLNGRDLVTITGHGLMLEDAHGAQLRRLAITQVKGDGLTATRSRGVEIDGLVVSMATDGLLDLNGGASVTVLGTTFRDNVRGVLCGNWQAPKDGREALTLIDVRFERVRVRTPKAEDCDVYARGLTVIDAVEWPVDARGTSVVILEGFTWIGPKINPPGWRADAAAIVEVVE